MAKKSVYNGEYEIYPYDPRFEIPSCEKTRFSVPLPNNDRQSSKNYAIIKRHAMGKIAKLTAKYGKDFFFVVNSVY